jgi:protein TonB
MKKPLLIILLLLTFAGAINAQTRDSSASKTNDTTLYLSVDHQPEFPGGYDALLAYVGRNIMNNARKYGQNIQGRIYIQMVVEKDGTPSHVKAIKGISKEIDQEVVKVIEKSPKWTPGIQDGKSVRTFFSFPLNLSINPLAAPINPKGDATKN